MIGTVLRARLSRFFGKFERELPRESITAEGRRAARIARARGYGWGVVVIMICTGMAHASARVLRLTDVLMIFPLGVCIVAARHGVGPAFFTAFGGVLAFDYMLLPPVKSF